MVSRPRGEHLNDQIVDAATELFRAGGFQGATADDIAESAGVTKRTLYRRMVSKEHILFEIHERFLKGLRESLAGIDADSGRDRLRQIILVHLQTIADNQGPIRIFYEEMKHLVPENRREVLRQRDEYWDLVQDILGEEVSRGTFRPLDLPIVAHGILGAVNEAYRWFRPDGELDAAAIADLATDLFLDGLAVDAVSPDVSVELPDVATPERNDVWSTDPTKVRILEAATDLFARIGYQATTTREIADAAGMTKAALYYHIGSKEEVLYQIVKRVNLDGTEAVMSVIKECLSPAEAFVRMCVAHARETARHRSAIAILHEDFKHLGGDKRDELAAERRLYTQLWTEVVVRGQQEGVFRTGNNSIVVLLIMGALSGLYRWYRPGSRLTAEEIGAALADLILVGVRRGSGALS